VKRNPVIHECSSRRLSKKVKNATKFWLREKVKDFLIVDATLGAKELVKKLKEHHGPTIPYHRVFEGKNLALKHLYGDWDNSFDNLFKFKAQVEKSYPDSLVIIDHHLVDDKIRFRRFFLAFKPCIDGFLAACRPYLAIDSTFLIGKYKGQLASAIVVDGHKWMYPVCFGIFDSEITENWVWFMSHLKETIGSPPGLTICTDAGQSVMAGVGEVFPSVEHKERMYHLVTNFKKRYHGKVFDDHLWTTAYSWSMYGYTKHMTTMYNAKRAAIEWLLRTHKKLWSRSHF
jgi:hypothetical protein